MSNNVLLFKRLVEGEMIKIVRVQISSFVSLSIIVRVFLTYLVAFFIL